MILLPVALSFKAIYGAYSAKSDNCAFINAHCFVRSSDSFRLSKYVTVVRRSSSITNDDINDHIPFGSDTPLVTTTIRKKRKNKYENFSRVNMDSDPLETLIEESNRMNREMSKVVYTVDHRKQQQQSMTREDVLAQITPTPNKIFPDNKGIDPYDPETFGYVFIGTVIGAHGVHGWLKIQCVSDFPLDRLCTAGIRHLKPVNKRAPREVVLLNGKHRLGDEYLIQLDQITDRDTAQKIRGSMLYIREEQKSYDLEADEYTVSDLVGSSVYLKAEENAENMKKYVGVVGGVVFSDDMCSIPGLGHDYLEIIVPRGVGGTLSFRDEMVLIPMVPQIVPEVDITSRRIFIDPPTGLLDLTYIRDEKTRIKGFLPPSKNY